MKRSNSHRWMMTPLFALFALLGMGTDAWAEHPGPGPKNGTVLIIRHAEKPPDNDSSPLLAAEGDARAQKYIEYFKNLKVGSHPETPQFVFATKESEKSNRPWLTVRPLVKALNLPHDNSIQNDQFPRVVALLGGGGFDGKTVLICWHHGKIPSLLDALGANHRSLLGAEEWPKYIYGWIVELQFDRDGNLKQSTIRNEHLMSDDNPEPPNAKPQ